jgi:hypothetical protein
VSVVITNTADISDPVLPDSFALSTTQSGVRMRHNLSKQYILHEIDSTMPTTVFCLFKQVSQSTSWIFLRYTIAKDRYEMSHTLSASVDDNFASMSNINVLIRCEQLSLSGQYIPYQTMTDQQLMYYCAVQFDSPFPSISQDYSTQFLFLEHCLQIARPTAHTLLPQYLRYTIAHAWRLIMQDSDLPIQLPDDIRSTALQVFTHMEREHDLRPIPFPSRFLRACLYFHPAITGPKYHLAYFRSLNLAFEILKSANSVLQLNSIENEPDTTSSGNSKNANDSPQHDGYASFDPDGSSDSTDNNQADTTFSLTLSSSRGQHAWSDKTMAEVIKLWQKDFRFQLH